MRGVDVSSDHHLLMTTVKLRLKRFTNANSTQTKYNVGLLRDKDTQAAFQINLSNRFQPLQELIEDNETDIETQWEHCKKLWQDACEEVLGKKKTQHKEWISADTIHKLETRRERKTVLNNSRTRAATARAQEEYTAVDREVKRSIKKDRRDYINDLARQAETAAEGPVPGDQEADGQVSADRQASDGQDREPADNKRTAETMGRTLQGAAEPPHS